MHVVLTAAAATQRPQHHNGTLIVDSTTHIMETIKNAAQTVVETVVGAVEPPKEPDDWLKASEVEVDQEDEDAKM